jgi:hypothetical protein
MVHNYKDWKALNESGWDSVDEDAGDIVINGVVLDLTIVYTYDTINCIGMSVYIKPTVNELIEIGVFSAGYADLDEYDRQILLYDNGEELSVEDLARDFGVSDVRQLEDSDIYDLYEEDYKKSLPDPLTKEQFVEIVKKFDWNMEDQGLSDILITTEKTQKGLKLLSDFDLFKNED